jgi:hypothetical protein
MLRLQFSPFAALKQSIRNFNTKPSKRARPKIDNPLPSTAGAPVVLDNGCTFIDLTAKAKSHFEENELPPLMTNLGSAVLNRREIIEMIALRNADPRLWTITQLSKRFKVSRSFVIETVCNEEEKQRLAEKIDQNLLNMSTKQQRGWIIRHKIRQDRESSW